MKPCALFDTPCWCDMMSFFSGDCKKAREAYEKAQVKVEDPEASDPDWHAWLKPATDLYGPSS